MVPPSKKQKICAESTDSCNHQSVPDEVWLSILSYLPPGSLCSLARTSHRFNQLTRDPILWTNLTIDWQSIKNKTASVENIISRSTRVRSLTVKNRTFEQVNSPQIVMIAKKASSTLRNLTLSPEIALGNNAVAKIGSMTQLTSLELAGDWIKTSGVKELGNLTKLERLKMPGAEQLTPKDLKDLFSRLCNLVLVDISDCKKGASDMAVTALAQNNPKLEYLALDECELVTGKSLKIVAEKCPNLAHLSLDGCYQVNDPAMVKIASSCPKLSYVSLGLCSTVKDSTLKQLAMTCPELSFLNLFGCSYITERGVAKLVEGAKGLKYLCIRGMIGVGQAFSEKLEKDHPDIQVSHQYQPKPVRDRSKKY